MRNIQFVFKGVEDTQTIREFYSRYVHAVSVVVESSKATITFEDGYILGVCRLSPNECSCSGSWEVFDPEK